MCGIAAAMSKDRASYDIANILEYLQHRGEDTAGIGTIGPEGFPLIHKKGGLVTSAFDKTTLEKLAGISGVGHTRYKTIGRGGVENAQPFQTTAVNNTVQIVMSHNGHVRNYKQLEKELRLEGILLESDCDVEPILKVLARNLTKLESEEDLYRAVEVTREQVIGAYTVVATIRNNKTNKTYLMAFTDKHAIRPGAIGRKEDSVAIASESRSLEINGYRQIRDLKPGETIIITEDLQEQSRVNPGQPAHCYFEWVYFSQAKTIARGLRVNEIRSDLGRQLAIENSDLRGQIDLVTFIPQTPLPAAKGFAEEMEVRFAIAVDKYRYSGRNFLKPTQDIREKDTAKNLAVLSEVVEGRRVAIVDDSIVRGTTSKHIVQEMRQAGATAVHLLSTAPPIAHPCELGINTPTYKELIAANRTPEQITQEIGADSVRFITLEGLLEVMTTHQSKATKHAIKRGIIRPDFEKLDKHSFCLACVTGENPTEAEFRKRLGQTL